MKRNRQVFKDKKREPLSHLNSHLPWRKQNKTKQNRKERGTNENHHAAEDSELQQEEEAPKSSDEI
jgi:hypothetical protein